MQLFIRTEDRTPRQLRRGLLLRETARIESRVLETGPAVDEKIDGYPGMSGVPIEAPMVGSRRGRSEDRCWKAQAGIRIGVVSSCLRDWSSTPTTTLCSAGLTQRRYIHTHTHNHKRSMPKHASPPGPPRGIGEQR